MGMHGLCQSAWREKEMWKFSGLGVIACAEGEGRDVAGG